MNEVQLQNHYSILEYKLLSGKDRISKFTFKRDKNDIFNTIIRKYNNGTYHFTPYKVININNNRKVYIASIRDRIVLNILKDHINNKYNIHYKNRLYEIKRLIEILDDKIPYTIIKLDISDYFNSINKALLFTKLKESGLLGNREFKLVTKSLGAYKKGVGQGLPISNPLAEIYIERLEWELKRISQNVVFYSRYVDDIIILLNGSSTYIELENLKDNVEKLIKKNNLNINEKKSMIQNLSGTTFNYLGYSITRDIYDKNRQTQVDLTISITQNKYNKECKKIIKTFEDFKANGRFELFKERLSILTHKNYILKAISKVDDDGILRHTNKKICFGLLENYRYISDLSILERLDKFITKNLYEYIDDKKIRSSLFKYSYKYNFVKKHINNYANFTVDDYIDRMFELGIGFRYESDEQFEHFSDYYKTYDLMDLQRIYFKELLLIYKGC